MLWLNGTFLNENDAHISVSDRGFLLGDGVFETMRATNGHVGWLSFHLQRISQSIDVLGGFPVKIPSEATLAKVISTLCQGFEKRHAVIRLTVSRGQGGQGLLAIGASGSTVLITAKPIDLDAGCGPLELAISKQVRRNPWSVASRMKSLNYLDNIVARNEAADAGAEDCLILTQDGHVGETTIANVFAMLKGRLYTAPKESGIFAGLSRACVIDWAQSNHISLCYDPVTIEQLKTTDCVFVCNALRGVRVVSSVGDYMLNQTQSGLKLITKLSQHLENSIGR